MTKERIAMDAITTQHAPVKQHRTIKMLFVAATVASTLSLLVSFAAALKIRADHTASKQRSDEAEQRIDSEATTLAPRTPDRTLA